MQIDRYQVIGRVAAGSTGLVYRAHDPQLGRDVAIKQLAGVAPQLREQYRAEARTLATLDSPHIVAIYDYLEDAGSAYIVEEWVDGASLGAMLATGVRLAPVQAVGVLHGALSGLAHAHARGIVHRDVSPANILIDRSGTSKLVDFGLASATGSLGSSGARAYQSPEALAGQPVTPRSDVYSAAALLAHLLKGRATVPPDASGIPEPLATVINYSLASDPQYRPPTAAELLAWLDQTAEQTFGAGWLGQASVAALVTAAGAAPLVALAGAGTAGAAVAGAGTATVGATGAGTATAGTATAGATAGAATAGTTTAGTASASAGAANAGTAAGSTTATAAHGSAASTGGTHSGVASAAHGVGKATLVKAGVGVAVVAAAATATTIALSSGGASGHTLNDVPAAADLYLATVANSTQIEPTMGKRPEAVTVPSSARTVSFPSVTGKIGCCTDPKNVHGPDGGTDFGATDIAALNGISGVRHTSATLFLAGVFVGSSKPDQTGQVDLSQGNTTAVQAPQLGQVFFIGDGHTARGTLQKVVVPAGAKTMYVGFVDASAFHGPPCCYDDNPGKVDVRYSFASASAQGTAIPTVSTSTVTPIPTESSSSAPPSVSPSPSGSSSPEPPPSTQLIVDGRPVTFSFNPTSPDPSEAAFQAPAGDVYLHVTQLSANLAEPFVRITIESLGGGSAVASPDFSTPTGAGGYQVQLPAAGAYRLSVTPAGTGSGTVTVSITSHP